MSSSDHDPQHGPLGPIHCHHEDVVAKIYALDREVHILRLRQEELLAETAKLKAWIADDAHKSAWIYESRNDLMELIASKKWLTVTRHVVAWVAGAILSAVLFWNAVWPTIKGPQP
jgi:hypothetical protein